NKKYSPLLAKASHVEFGAAKNPLHGWSFSEIEPGKFAVTRDDGVTIDAPISSQDNLLDLGVVSVDSSGDLIIGDNKIIQGANLMSGWSAKRSTGKSFKVTDPNGASHIAKRDEFFIPLNGIVQLDSYGNLSVEGGSSIRVLKKTAEIEIKVHNKQENGGYSCYINRNEINKQTNGKDGTKGVFYPSKDGKPAYFTETFGGQDIITAYFRPATEINKVVTEMLTPQDGLAVRKIKSRMDVIVAECNQFSISPAHHQEYVILKEQLIDINRKTNKYPMDVSAGYRAFGMQTNYNNERSYQR
ncbi:hypothetical protein LMH73_012310, partial [Vibrio splendidus]